ncbi:MAG: nucleotide sugar dehydrogenase, partial [Flavobacteriaceae bacterium]
MKNYNLCIVGLGYVGLPLAVAFAEKYKTIGFDINQNRVEELKNLIDSTKEIDSDSLKNIIKTESEKEWENNKGLFPTSDVKKIQNCNVYIITV